VNWQDEFGEVLCRIHADCEGVATATELISGTLDSASYALEANTDVRPIFSATVDWHDDAGPCFAELSIQDFKLLAKSTEWASEEDRQNGCFITSISEIEGEIDEDSGWSIYGFK